MKQSKKHPKSIPLILLLTFVLVTIGGSNADARVYEGFAPPEPVLMTDRVEVQFETDVEVNNLTRGAKSLSLGISSLDNVFSTHGIRNAEKMFPWRSGKEAVVEYNDMSKIYVLEVPADADYETVVSDLKSSPYVRKVSPVYAMPVDAIPNDPQFPALWGVKKIQDTLAWDYEKGSEEAIIAIADAGVLYTHADLKDNIWVNPGEDLDGDDVVMDLGDEDGTDNDGNGRTDDLIGYDFFSGLSGLTIWPGEDAGGPDNDPSDFNGHGTHCAGIAAMVSNNNTYGSGVAGGWGGGNGPNRGPRIMCLRIGASAEHPEYGYETGYINTANAAQAIDYAANNGACVINCSWGSSNAAGMDAALAQANISGMVVVHSAGNGGNYSTSGGYMDNYFYNGYEVAMSVAATQQNDSKASFSTYGPFVDISAPGVSIWSTYSNHYLEDFQPLQGTSMSSPMVAGVAALIKSKMPAWDKFTIDSVIKNTADDIDAVNPGLDGMLGSGRVNAYKAVKDLPDARFETVGDLVAPVPLTLQFNDLSPNSPSAWEWDFGDGNSSFDQNPQHEFTEPGLYTVSMTVTEPRGTTTETLHRLVMATADTVSVDSVLVEPSAADQQVMVPIRMTNNFLGISMSIPLQAKVDGVVPPASQVIAIDSISLVGTRCDEFEVKQISPYDETNHRYGIILRSDNSGGSDYLQAGSGVIVNVFFTIDGGIANGTDIDLVLGETAFTQLEYTTPQAEFNPEFEAGKITIYAPYICGDANEDQKVDILDILFLIDFKYGDGPAPNTPEAGDVNLDGNIDILDILFLIDYKYQDGPEPCNP